MSEVGGRRSDGRGRRTGLGGLDTFHCFRPILDDIYDVPDIGALTPGGTFIQFILVQAIFRALIASCGTFSENRAFIQPVEISNRYGKSGTARVIEKEGAGQKVIEVYLIPDDFDTRIN